MKCTSCGSISVDERRIGMSIGAGAGAAAGVYLGTKHLSSDDNEDDFIGAFGLFAACTAAGAAAGSTLDGTLIDNYQCNKCGHTFKAGLSAAMLADMEYSDAVSSSAVGLATGTLSSAGYRAAVNAFHDIDLTKVEGVAPPEMFD